MSQRRKHKIWGGVCCGRTDLGRAKRCNAPALCARLKVLRKEIGTRDILVDKVENGSCGIGGRIARFDPFERDTHRNYLASLLGVLFGDG